MVRGGPAPIRLAEPVPPGCEEALHGGRTVVPSDPRSRVPVHAATSRLTGLMRIDLI
jgi:hypothetical protein